MLKNEKNALIKLINILNLKNDYLNVPEKLEK